MENQEYIKECLLRIEKKLNWGEAQSWKESDFKTLSEIIFKTTKISISLHTLKRLFGKIKYNKYYNPQHATKDALAIYIGYKDWDDFVLNNPESSSIDKATTSQSPLLKNGLIFTTMIIVLGLVVTLVFSNLYSQADTIEVDSYKIELLDSVGKVPYTVNINYETGEIKSDSLFFDFNFIHPFRGPQIVKVDKERINYYFTYQIPGYYQLSLLYKNQILKTKNVLAMSDGWASYIFYENDMNYQWLDNKLVDSISDGYLYISPVEIDRQGFETVSVFYVSHNLFKEFNIDGDNFLYKTRFKNSAQTGGITCFDSVFRLYCQKGESYILLMEDGCSQYSKVKFGELILHGEYNDLSALKLEPGRWNDMEISVRHKKVEVLINDVLIYKGEYKQNNGNIVGMQFMFKGIGQIDYVELQDLSSGEFFTDDFTK